MWYDNPSDELIAKALARSDGVEISGAMNDKEEALLILAAAIRARLSPKEVPMVAYLRAHFTEKPEPSESKPHEVERRSENPRLTGSPKDRKSGQGEAGEVEIIRDTFEMLIETGGRDDRLNPAALALGRLMESLAARRPESAEPYLPWRDLLEIAMAENTKLIARAEKAESEAKALREAARPLVKSYLCNPDSPSEFVAYRSGPGVIAEWHALRAALREDEVEKGKRKRKRK
jgi:hypothetical protein